MLLHAYFAGLIILGAALLLNVLASRLGLKSWYDYVKSHKDITAFDYAWLYVLYPLGLGLAGALALLFKLD